MKTSLFSDKDFLRKLVSLTLPSAFQSLMLAAVAACDALMLGRLEQNAMAAVSLASQIQFVQNMFIMTITGTIAILGAQYWGKGDKDTINRIFCISLRLAAALSAVFFLGCMLFPRQLMMIFAGDETLIEIGAGYLRIAGRSYLLTGVSQCYLAIMKISDQVKRSAWISSGAAALNIVLNAVLIFGLLGNPALGVKGAAIATLIARIAELIWAVASSFQKDFIRPDLRRFFVRDRLLAADYRRCALPLLGGSLFWGVGFTSYTAIMGHLGADAAAANSVAAVIRDMMCCVSAGVGIAGGIMVGNALGAGDLGKGRLYGERVKNISVLIGFLSMAIVLLLTPLVVHSVKLTDTARGYLIGMMIMMSVYMVGRSINNVVINGVFCAGGDTLFDVYSLAVSMWCLAIPLALLSAFVFHWPVLAVYFFTCADEVFKLPWVFLHYRKYKWVKDLTR